MTIVWRASLPTWSDGRSGWATTQHRWFTRKADAEAWLRQQIDAGLLCDSDVYGPRVEKQTFPNDRVSLAQMLNRK